LSRGFGFVELDSPGTARSVRRAMQGKTLEGRALKIEMSAGGASGGDGGDGGDAKVPKGFSATKIVVRNVAFEATKRDIQKLFNPFGALKSCRLPKKFDGNHRGFAFVELSTKREATSALEALRGTHLYGRKLVIERAAEGDDVETTREKTAAHFENAEAGRSAAEGEPIVKRARKARRQE
jgi:multiple RNA-binding domain-containing protein 1